MRRRRRGRGADRGKGRRGRQGEPAVQGPPLPPRPCRRAVRGRRPRLRRRPQPEVRRRRVPGETARRTRGPARDDGRRAGEGGGRGPVIGLQRELEGVLLVDKPGEHTSHDVIARLRGKLRMRKIGHAGTLDPMATGLLIVLVGKATRVSQYIISLDKEYEGAVMLGVTTDSQDADGETMETRPVPDFSEAHIRSAMQGFLGDQYQTPPMFSAIKIGGVPLYKLARKGEDIEREPRFIRVMAWDLLGFASPRIE